MSLLLTRIAFTFFIAIIAGYLVYIVWTEQPDPLAFLRKFSTLIPVKKEEVREVNKAELADTTPFEEAFIMDMYLEEDSKHEAHAYIDRLLRASLEKGEWAELPSHRGAYEDLLARGIIREGKIAEKRVSDKTTMFSNVFLTEKGVELARDILYLRKHPEVASKLMRPRQDIYEPEPNSSKENP